MGDAIGQVLAFGVGVALSPVPIIAVVLMLGTPRGRTNGLAFLAGWALGLAVVGTIVLVVAGGAGASTSGGPATWVGVLKLLLGGALLLLAAREYRGRPRAGQKAALPKWMAAIDRFTPTRSLAVGAALSGVNPKNLLLTAGAAAAIAQRDLSTGQDVIAMAVFVLVGALGPGLPVAIFFLMGDKAAKLLGELNAWLSANNATIMAVLCLIIGVKLIGDGISVVTG